jgi:NAD(P)-dependent dehydrogenase (short-subunit alcohol dehydrogenase family)
MGTKAALITGAARRIGRAIALYLAGEGWDVAIHYNTSHGEALSLRGEVMRAGADCRLYAADLSDSDAAAPLIERCVADFPHVSLLVNSASVFKRDTIPSPRSC